MKSVRQKSSFDPLDKTGKQHFGHTVSIGYMDKHYFIESVRSDTISDMHLRRRPQTQITFVAALYVQEREGEIMRVSKNHAKKSGGRMGRQPDGLQRSLARGRPAT